MSGLSMRMFDYRGVQVADYYRALAQRGRSLFRRPIAAADGAADIEQLARRLLSNRGEASGVALAAGLVQAWRALDTEGQLQWFLTLAKQFGPDEKNLDNAVEEWRRDRSPEAAARLAIASEPRRQELMRRINLAPRGTAALVSMRAELLKLVKQHPGLGIVDQDFVHLLGSWFNRGFLLMSPIDWSSPAATLEKIIRYEAVHEIKGWDDLRRRLQPLDRRCFAFFHPQMPDEPLIFVEVALAEGIPRRIDDLLGGGENTIPPTTANSAVFYSISNTQVGLKGISFGNFLIKQVVEDLLRELPNLNTFVTLSPIPGFSRWLHDRMATDKKVADRIELLTQPNWAESDTDTRLSSWLAEEAAEYLVRARDDNGRPLDPVARFHLGNGARLEQININADHSERGLQQSFGMMVNYLYDLEAIEANHEAYANRGSVVCSRAVQRLLAARQD